VKNRERVLSFLQNNPGCTQQQISKALDITPNAQVNQILHMLMQKGLAYRAEEQRPYRYYPEEVNRDHQAKKITIDKNNGTWSGSGPEPWGHSERKHTQNEDELITNIDHYYKRSLEVSKEFGGPSIYFHVQAIKEQERAFLSDRHIEMIYATLASWGMHKMGNSEDVKAKIVEFPEFKRAILNFRDELQRFYHLSMDSCTQEQYEKYIDDLKQVYYGLNVSSSEATIVANSKTLAHILPDLIPPIDRHHTVRFFKQNKRDFFYQSGKNRGKYRAVSLPKDIDKQFNDFKKYCCRIKMLFDRSNHQSFVIDKESFNTSYPKIMDNLIIAFVKDVPKPEKKA